MKKLICDICKDVIDGEYKEVYGNNTNGVQYVDDGRMDVCKKCWSTFANCIRVSEISFPNKEVENGKG